MLDYYDDNDQKLLLKSIHKQNGSLDEPPYQFEYFSPVNNADNPLSTDHWGFPNHSTTVTNLPVYSGVTPSEIVFEVNGSDRSPNIEGSKSYLMKKIKYPTGAYKEFQVELNQAAFINDESFNQYFENIAADPELQKETLFYKDDFSFIQEVEEYFNCNSNNIQNNNSCTNSFEIINDFNQTTIVNLGISGRIYLDEFNHIFSVGGKNYALKYIVQENSLPNTLIMDNHLFLDREHTLFMALGLNTPLLIS